MGRLPENLPAQSAVTAPILKKYFKNYSIIYDFFKLQNMFYYI